MDTGWVEVGPEQEFAAGIRPIRVNEERLLICKVEDRLFATVAKCPHAGVPMDRADVDGTLLTCPFHGWRFDLACAGREIHGYRPLETRAVRVEGGLVYVALQGDHAE